MLCERVLGNVERDPPARFAGKARDTLEVAWRDCGRRALRGASSGGATVGVLLPRGTALRHGDVLAESDRSILVVSVTPCEVWVADFADPTLLASAALELGNLHVPVEVAPPFRLIALPDGPTRGVFDRYASKWREDVRRFHPLRATVLAGVKLAPEFTAAPREPQLTNSRE